MHLECLLVIFKRAKHRQKNVTSVEQAKAYNTIFNFWNYFFRVKNGERLVYKFEDQMFMFGICINSIRCCHPTCALLLELTNC